MRTYHLLCHLLGYRDWIIGLDGNLHYHLHNLMGCRDWIIGLDENLHYHLLYILMGYRDWIICLDENLHYHLLYHLLGYRDWIICLDGNLLSSFSFNSFFFFSVSLALYIMLAVCLYRGAANSATIRCGNSIVTPWSI